MTGTAAGTVSYTHLDVYKRQLEEDTGTRLDSFLSRRVEGLTRSAAARLLAEGLSLIHI